MRTESAEPSADHVPASASKTAALYVVAGPIGHLGDITRRAVETLRAVDLVAAEDTRHTLRLLDHLGLSKPMFALHEHNEAGAAARLVERLRAGESVALVSDAGTPGVSDPGARAVAAVRRAGFRVVPIPGPNAAVAALSAAGMAETGFVFAGFLPARGAARRKALGALARLPLALVFHESPHRVLESVADMAEVLGGGREIVVARELTKVFESIERLPLAQAAQWLAADPNRQRGEFVLVVSGAPADDEALAEGARLLALLLEELPLRTAARLAARATGASKNALYEIGLARRDGAA